MISLYSAAQIYLNQNICVICVSPICVYAYPYINNSRHLVRKYARIFVRGHYLFREANSFPRAKLKENCELRGADNVQGQISEHIFTPNGDYCLYYASNLFAMHVVLKIGEYSRIFPSFSWGIFGHVTHLTDRA